MISFLKDPKFDVKDPLGRPGQDAGIDLFCPSYNEHFAKVFEEENGGQTLENSPDGWLIRIPPHSDVLINSGLYTKFPSNIALIGFNKSGVSTKQKLVVGACVDDTSYQGLLHLHVINTSNEHQEIYCGNKVVQWVPVLIDNSGFEVVDGNEVSKDKFFGQKSVRGDGCMGSTGLK